MADDVRLWSDELARDPSSLVFLPLAESLRRRGELELARKIARHGLERHPGNADAHDQLARIHADCGELDAALAAWESVLQLAPGHVGATKGIAFVLFQQGRLNDAERLLLDAQARAEGADLSAAISTVRRSGAMHRAVDAALPADPRTLFAAVVDAGQAAMLLDRDGLVIAGAYASPDGRDVAEEMGASLSGVSGEAQRAMRHLDLGAWQSIVFETEGAVVSVAPAPETGSLAAGGVLLVVAPPSTPLGQLRRLLERCRDRAAAWLAGGTAAAGSNGADRGARA